MEKNHPLQSLLSTTMENIHNMVDANTIIGTPIKAEGVTLIPVSRLSVGLLGGGSDFTTKNQKPDQENTFGGGSAANAKLEPVAFLVVRGDSVKLIPAAPIYGTAIERVIDAVPEMLDKVTDMLEKHQEKKQRGNFTTTLETDFE